MQSMKSGQGTMTTSTATALPTKKRARPFQPIDKLTDSERKVVGVLAENGGWCGRMTVVNQAQLRDAWLLRDIYTSLIGKGWLILGTNGRVAFTAKAIEYAKTLRNEAAAA